MGFTYRRRTKQKEYAFVLCGNIENNIILPSSVQAVGRVQRPAADFPLWVNFNIWRCEYMFDYEYNYRTLKEAQEAKKQAGKGAKITTFLSTNENMEIITIYKLTFKALF